MVSHMGPWDTRRPPDADEFWSILTILLTILPREQISTECCEAESRWLWFSSPAFSSLLFCNSACLNSHHGWVEPK